MKENQDSPANIREYMEQFPKETQNILRNIYAIVKREAPKAEEKMSYGMPTFVLNGRNLVHFAGYKQHIGLYPTPNGITQFEAELQKYKHAKGTIQFQLDEPIPYDLIRKIVAFRVQETMR